MSCGFICGTVFINGTVNCCFPEFISLCLLLLNQNLNKLNVWKTVINLSFVASMGFKEPVLMKIGLSLLLVNKEHWEEEHVAIFFCSFNCELKEVE